MEKTTVHNELEGKTLIKEAYAQGDEAKFDGCKFFTHDGDFLFTCKTSLTEFEMDYSCDGEIKGSLIVLL